MIFWLFPALKQRLAGCTFDRGEKLSKNIETIVKDLASDSSRRRGRRGCKVDCSIEMSGRGNVAREKR